jgi:hypothetical protein
MLAIITRRVRENAKADWDTYNVGQYLDVAQKQWTE